MTAGKSNARAQRSAERSPKADRHKSAPANGNGSGHAHETPADSVTNQLLWLQAAAGNHAVSIAVQAERNATAEAAEAKRPNPTAIFDAIAADYPGIVGAMSFDDLTAWREWLGSWAHNKGVDEAEMKAERAYRAREGYSADMPIYRSDWLEQRARIQSGKKPIDENGGRATLDPAKILDDDVVAIPQWNVAPETRYRQWAVERFATKPLAAELTERKEIYSAIQAQQDPGIATNRPHVNLLWGGRTLDNTKGKVTFADLQKIPEFADKYRTDVWDGPEVQAIRNGIGDLNLHISTMLTRHIELSDKNRGAEYEGTTGEWAKKKIRGGVRHISEGLGAPSMIELQIARLRAQANPDDTDAQADLAWMEARSGDYPPWDENGIWDKPMHESYMARKFLHDGQVELAAGALLEAEQSTAIATSRFAGYEARVMGGAGIAVKWLERAKAAGKIASAFTGVSGVVETAAMAAGYTMVQEGGQEAVETALDPEHKADFGRVAKMAAIDGLAAMFGGITQGAFTNALSARFGNTLMTTWKISAPTAEKVINAMSAATSSFYNVPAKIVMENIINKKAMPTSLAEVSDMVVKQALTSTVMTTAGELVQSYSKAPDTPTTEPSGGAKPEEAGASAAKPEGAGGAKPEGTGAAKPEGVLTEKQQTAHERLVEALESGGETTVNRPSGPSTPQTREARVKSSPVSADALALARQMLPIHNEWTSLSSGAARAERIAHEIYPTLAETGMPPLKKFESVDLKGSGAQLDDFGWGIKVNKSLFDKPTLTEEEFAVACAQVRHEVEHALDWYRMARLEAERSGDNAKTLARRLGIPADIAAAAIEANVGWRPRENLTPGSPLAKATEAKYENVYTKSKESGEVLRAVTEGWNKVIALEAQYQKAVSENLPPALQQAALREIEEARVANQENEAKYRAMPEEIAAFGKEYELQRAIQIVQRLRRARRAEDDAYAVFEPLSQQVAAVSATPGHVLDVATRREYERALHEWVESARHAGRLELEVLKMSKTPAAP